MRSSLLFLSSIASTLGYFVPLCHYNFFGQYVCFPPQEYFDSIHAYDQIYQTVVNKNVQNLHQWQQNVLQQQIDTTNQFPWLANNPFIQHQQTLQKEWLDYYQGFQQGVIERNFQNHENRLKYQEDVSKQQHETLSG